MRVKGGAEKTDEDWILFFIVLLKILTYNNIKDEDNGSQNSVPVHSICSDNSPRVPARSHCARYTQALS